MKTTNILAAALVAFTGVAALAAPALANEDHSKLFDSQYYVQQLRYDGVNAVAADEVTNDVFRATVRLPNGQQAYAFYDKDSLQPVKQG
jgi:hypothetical protein